MLLPQSSAFAALKNRLNSVSAIGFLHIAPRTYVPSRNNSVADSISTYQFPHKHVRQKSSEAHAPLTFSAPSTAGPSSFDRSSRLKGRDEGGIRWNELLEKFRSVQERARRAQRQGSELDDGLGFGTGGMGMGDRGDGMGDAMAFRNLARPSVPVKDTPTPAVPAAQKNKSSLGKFGRLGGVSGRPKR